MKVRTTKHIAKAIVLMVLLVFGSVSSISAQTEVWPGDINDNGIVNNIDLLYWGIAQKERGAKRDTRGTDWHAYAPAVDWTLDYLSGLNYSQGDADGKGKIERSDRDAILKDNYGLIHGVVVPDAFLVGDANVDPLIWMEAQNAVVLPGESVSFDVYLGDAAHSIGDYFGIAFTISIDPEIVEPEVNNPWTPNSVSFDLLSDTWLNGSGNRRSNSYVYWNESAGELDVVLMRNKLGTNSGHGQIASFTIITEDIVFLNDTNTGIIIDDIKLIDDNMIEYPVAGSTEFITIQSNAGVLVSGNTGLVPAEQAASVDGKQRERISEPEINVPHIAPQGEALQVKLFPNPSAAWLQIEQGTQATRLENIVIYNVDGVVVLEEVAQDSAQQLINIAGLPTGNYFLHLHTASGKSVMQFHKSGR